MSYRFVGIGEVLWDLLPDGPKLGGAPGNFAYHAGALGADARVVSRVGNDDPGREAVRQLSGLGVSTECVEVDSELPTGTVGVELSAEGQARFTIHEDVAWDRIAGEGTAERAVREADVICFGTLAQRSARSRETIRRLVSAARAGGLRILDVNLRPPHFSKEVIEDSLKIANVFKLNETELPQLASMFDLRGGIEEQLRSLMARFELRCLAFTRGNLGSWLLHGDEISKHPGIAVEVVDTVGAGDAFTAATALGLLAGWPLNEVNRRASELAAFVCSQAGATPKLPESLRRSFTNFVKSPG